MDLFSLLCVNENNDFFKDLILLIWPLFSTILLIYGLIVICNNIGKKEKLKRGIITFCISIVLIVLSIFVMSINSSLLNDSCGNRSNFYSITKAVFNIEEIFVPFAFIIMAIFRMLQWLFCDKKEVKKELAQKIIRYLVIALLIFIIMMIINLVIGTFVDIPESTSWATCWC